MNSKWEKQQDLQKEKEKEKEKEENKNLYKAINLLKSGDIVAMPTETVYGLAACIDQPKAIEKIFRIKERPFFDPLIVHIGSYDQLKKVVIQWSDLHQLLAENFWPGPLTLIAPKHPDLNPLITSGLDTVGVRFPNHLVALKLINTLNIPLAAPSANKFKRTSPTCKEHVEIEFGKELLALEGGGCKMGLESTIVEIKNFEIKILRPGLITKSMIENVLKNTKYKNTTIFAHNENYKNLDHSNQITPGSMEDHYQPCIPLYLIQKSDLKNISIDLNQGYEIILPDDPILAARSLYTQLHELKNISIKTKVKFSYLQWNDKLYKGEIWETIKDRLKKASSFIV